MSNKLPITVIALTLDEEFHLPEFLDHVTSFAEDVFIVDSLSSDNTVDIAIAKGVKIVQRPFTSFGDQWDFAIQMLPITTPWVMKLDPDERCDPDILLSIAKVLNNDEYNGWLLPLQLFFQEKPLPLFDAYLRLWRHGTCHFEKVLVNEHAIVKGSIGEISLSGGRIKHLDSKNLHRWFEKQNHYTTLAAIELYNRLPQAAAARLFGKSKVERRMALKAIYYRIPFAPPLEFLYHLFFNRAILAGRTGIRWAFLRSLVRYMTNVKIHEFKLQGAATSPPKRPCGEYNPLVTNSNLQKQLEKMSGENLRRMAFDQTHNNMT